MPGRRFQHDQILGRDRIAQELGGHVSIPGPGSASPPAGSLGRLHQAQFANIARQRDLRGVDPLRREFLRKLILRGDLAAS